jgi:hypothetical protein
MDKGLSDQIILEQAKANMEELDGIFTVDNLGRLESDLRRKLFPERLSNLSLRDLWLNRGDGLTVAQRFDALRSLGATQATFEAITRMTRLDKEVWTFVRERKQ